jgi:hypothetical protein
VIWDLCINKQEIREVRFAEGLLEQECLVSSRGSEMTLASVFFALNSLFLHLISDNNLLNFQCSSNKSEVMVGTGSRQEENDSFLDHFFLIKVATSSSAHLLWLQQDL